MPAARRVGGVRRPSRCGPGPAGRRPARAARGHRKGGAPRDRRRTSPSSDRPVAVCVRALWHRARHPSRPQAARRRAVLGPRAGSPRAADRGASGSRVSASLHTSPPGSGLTASWPLGLSHSVTVRPIRPEDIDLHRQFALGLSQETRYNRFLGAGIKLTPKLLEMFTRIDFSRDMALIASTTIEGVETAIGVARYARLADGTTCEFAITVADAWQGHGIGRRLLSMLID